MPAVTLDLTEADRLEVGALYRKEITVYLPAPAGTVAARLHLRVDGVWTVTYLAEDGTTKVEELADPPGGSYESEDVVYARQDGLDGPWLVDALADLEDLSEYTGAFLQIRRKRDSSSQVVLEYSSDGDPGGLTFQANVAPQLVLEAVIPEDTAPGTWAYDVKLLGAEPRRLIEGKVNITTEVTTHE